MNTDPSGNIPHWLGNVLSALNYAGTLGFAALHRRWAMITGTVLMMGLSTFAAVAALVAEKAPPLLTAATAGYTAGINGIFIASAAAPNKGLNIAGAIVGGIDVAVTLATAGTGIASAGASWVKRIMNVETDGIITGNKTRRVVMEMRHFVEDDDKGRIPVGANDDILAVQNLNRMNILWKDLFRDCVQDMTRTDIPALLVIARRTTKRISKGVLDDLLKLENEVKTGVAAQITYDNMVDKLVKSFGDIKLYTPAIRIEHILPEGSEAIVIGQTLADRKKFIGFISYLDNSLYGRPHDKRYWMTYQMTENNTITLADETHDMIMGDAGPLEVSAILILNLGLYTG